MLYLIYYTAVTNRGQFEGNSTVLIDSLGTADEIEALRTYLTKSVKKSGAEVLGSGKVVIANIINIGNL